MVREACLYDLGHVTSVEPFHTVALSLDARTTARSGPPVTGAVTSPAIVKW